MNRKDRVAAAFSAAATTYESAARPQELSADRLCAEVLALPLPPQPAVLEFGCGTGLLSRRLHPRLPGQWLITDLSPAMVAAARRVVADARFAVMDGEHPDLDPARFDLIVSNLAAQWFTDLGQAAARLRACLKPGGYLVFSTMGARSFQQWRAAHAVCGLSCGVPAFPDRAELARLLPAGARIVEQEFLHPYADGRAFVREVKAIGAGTPSPQHRPLSVADMRRVLNRLGRPAAMTYHILHAVITAE